MSHIKKHYDNLYGSPGGQKSVFGPPEKGLTKLLNSTHKIKRALDLGCGDGRNTIFLASRGLKVVGIDDSLAGLKKLRDSVKNQDKIMEKIYLEKADLETVRLEKNKFNLVIMIQIFHEIGAGGVKHVITQAKLSTKLLGINYLVFFLPKNGTYMRRGCYYPNESTIIKQYRGWKLLKKKKVLTTQGHMTPSSKKRLIKHQHYICHLLLQKLPNQSK